MWFPHTKVKVLAEKFRKNPPFGPSGAPEPKPLPTQCCVGPAAIWALKASILAWLLFISVPYPVFLDSACDYRDHKPGVTTYYDSKMVWVCVAPFLLALLAIEAVCLRYYIIPVIQVLGQLRVIGCQVRFAYWLPASFALSLAGHMDLVTNGIFLATTLRTMNHCRAQWNLACVWLYTMEDGMFGMIPQYRRLFHFSFDDLVWWFWLCMLIQAIHGWLAATPLEYLYRFSKRIGLERVFRMASARQGWLKRGCIEEIREEITECESQQSIRQTYSEMSFMASQRGYDKAEIDHWWNTGCRPVECLVSYEVSTEQECRDVLEGAVGEKTMYQTCFDIGPHSKTGHGAVLLALADSCRMTSITATRILYAKTKVPMYLRNRESGPAFGLMKQVAHATLYRIALAGMFQTGVQLNLQVTLLGMTTLMSKIQHSGDAQPVTFNALSSGHAVDRQMVFSICVGLFNFFRNFIDALVAIRWIHNVLQIPEESGLKDFSEETTFRAQMVSWRRWLSAMVLAYFAVFLYTMAKLWGVFQCPYSMFNINGCATSEMSFCLHGYSMDHFNASAENMSY